MDLDEMYAEVLYNQFYSGITPWRDAAPDKREEWLHRARLLLKPVLRHLVHDAEGVWEWDSFDDMNRVVAYLTNADKS